MISGCFYSQGSCVYFQKCRLFLILSFCARLTTPDKAVSHAGAMLCFQLVLDHFSLVAVIAAYVYGMRHTRNKAMLWQDRQPAIQHRLRMTPHSCPQLAAHNSLLHTNTGSIQCSRFRLLRRSVGHPLICKAGVLHRAMLTKHLRNVIETVSSALFPCT